jgi:5-methylcytosine-specific restriction endonuclease McrA
MKLARQQQLFAFVFARDGGRCAYCGVAVRPRQPGLHRAPDLATLDHLHPRSQGGRTCEENLVLACQACNNARGVMEAEAFRALVRQRGERSEGD